MIVGEVREFEFPPGSIFIAGEGVRSFCEVEQTATAKVLLVRPREAGDYTIQVQDGERQTLLRLLVSEGDALSLVEVAVRRVLGHLDGVEIVQMGDRVLLLGTVFSDRDLAKVQKVEEEYAEVCSFVELSDTARILPTLSLMIQVIEVSRRADSDVGMDWGSDPVASVAAYLYAIKTGGLMATPEGILNLRGEKSWIKVRDTHVVEGVVGTEFHAHRGGELKLALTGVETASMESVKYGFLVTGTAATGPAGVIELDLQYEWSAPHSLGKSSYDLQKTEGHVARQIFEGETIFLAFSHETTMGRANRGIPGLKDIPVLGTLFGSRSYQKGESIAVIVLTPSIVVAADDAPFIRRVDDEYEEKEASPW